MSEFSNYLENKIVEHCFQGKTYTAPTNLYLALHSANPDEDASGSELSGNGYSRQSASFGDPSNGVAENNTELTFTSTGDWSAATHFALWDASSNGNMLMYSALDSAVDIDSSGQSIVFATGSITITVT